MSEEIAKCQLCGEPMPAGEEMFNFHGYSGPCPKNPLPYKRPTWVDDAAKECTNLFDPHEEAFAEIIDKHRKQAKA